MASTYSPNLRLELIGTGEQQGTWGSTTNTNLGTLLEEAIGGYVSVTVSDVADTTLTTSNGSADQSRNMVINLTGALTGTRNVICPAIEKLYVVKNATTGSQSIVFKVSGQTGITVPNGATYFLYVDGTDARQVTGSIAAQNSNNVSITGGSISGATVSNSSLSNVSVVANASSLSVRDADGSNIMSIAVGSNLTANRTFTLTTGDAARTLDISAGNVTISTAGANLIDDADAAAQRTTLGLGTGDSPEFTAINIGNATDTTLSRSAAGVLAVEGKPVVMTTGAQTVEFADGTASAPSITNNGDTNTGIYFPAADEVSIAAGGTQVARFLSVSGSASFELPGGSTATAAVNVGEGRTGNGYALIDLVGDATYSDYGFRLFRDNTGANANSTIFHRGTGELQFYTVDAGAFTIYTNSSERFRIASGGNVGIGTNNPATLCHINGTIRYTNRPAAGTITAIGYDTNGDLKNSSSSLRYKHDVQDYTKGLDTVMQLRPVTFKFNGETRQNSGFIAEEIDAAGLSEVMLYDEEGRPDGVLYANMVALLTKALQEASAKIDALEARIAALESA